MNREELLKTLQERFLVNLHRHKTVKWDYIHNILKEDEELCNKVMKMENSGGEVDVFTLDGKLYFVDFSKEAPKNRRNICYDKEARMKRKKFPPKNSALEIADEYGVRLLCKEEYLALQNVEDIDLKTSVWLMSPYKVREKGGAIFGDKRYGETFIYHNGADSYYSTRGARFILEIVR